MTMRCEVKRRQHRLILFLFVLFIAFVRLLSRRHRPLDETLLQFANNSTPFSSTFSRQFSTSAPTTGHAFESTKRNDDFRLSDVDFRIELTYPPFTPRWPHFIDDLDRATFSDDPVNLRYLRAQPSRELTGRVKVVRDATIRVRRHECSWLTTEDEFQTASQQHLSDVDRRARHENNDSSIVVAFQCPLLVPDGHTFQHFIDGVFPKLVQLLRVIGDLSSSVQYILFRPRDHVIYEILDTLGISRDQLVLVPPPLDHLDKTHEYDVIRSSRLIDTCVTPAVHPALWQQARRLLVGTDNQETRFHDDLIRSLKEQSIVAGESSPSSDNEQLNKSRTSQHNNSNNNNISFLQSNDPSESVTTQSDLTYSHNDMPSLAPGPIVLLSRRWSRNRGRRLLNDRAVHDELVAHFGPSRVVLYPDRLAVRENNSGRRSRRSIGLSAARRIFSSAHMVIGVHGGAFYNIVMAPVNCTVIEVMPSLASHGNASRVPPGLAHTIVWRMAEALGHNYWRLYAPATSAYADVTLPVDRLQMVLKRL